MSAQVSVATGIDSTSKIRSSLTSITPIRTRDTIRHCGMNFDVVKTKYVIPEETESFEDYSRLQYAMVFNNITIPDRFDKDKLIEYFSEKSINQYEDDNEFQHILDQIEKRTVGKLGSFIDMINLFKNRYINNLDDRIDFYAESVYETNIPFHVLTGFVRSIKMSGMFLNYLGSIIFSHNLKLSSNIARSNYKREQLMISRMKGDINKLFDISEPLFFNEKCLKMLLIVSNAQNYEKFEDTEVLDFSDVPKDDFNRIFTGFKNNIVNLRRYILNTPFGRVARNNSNTIHFPDLKYDFNNYLNSAILNDMDNLKSV